ncbi:MAG: hypothetical protein AAF990_13140 [Bacteroidota bacterium]
MKNSLSQFNSNSQLQGTILKSKVVRQVFTDFCPKLLQEPRDSLIISHITHFLLIEDSITKSKELHSQIVLNTNEDLGIALKGIRSEIRKNKYTDLKQLDYAHLIRKERLKNVLLGPSSSNYQRIIDRAVRDSSEEGQVRDLPEITS